MVKKVSVLFVCLGNICRSPTAEGVFQSLINNRSLSEFVHVDSCGTSDWHVGSSPDSRSAAAAQQRGYDLSSLRGRQVDISDFNHFDYIIAMDTNNLRDLKQLMPSDYTGQLALLLDYSEQSHYRDVPDPYSLGANAFELVLDLVEDAAQGLLADIKRSHLQDPKR